MVALIGILLLCGAVMLVVDFVSGFFTSDLQRAAICACGIGVCALLLIGFYVL